MTEDDPTRSPVKHHQRGGHGGVVPLLKSCGLITKIR